MSLMGSVISVNYRLLKCAHSGDVIFVHHLIKNEGADINFSDDGGDTALTLAAKYGHLNVVNFLLENGVNVNHQTRDWDTALILAAWNGHLVIVKSLVDHGAKVFIRNRHSKTAQEVAEARLKELRFASESDRRERFKNNATEQDYADIIKLLRSTYSPCGV